MWCSVIYRYTSYILVLCYWESKWALLEPFIVKGVRNCSIALNGKRKCIVI